MKQVFTYQYFRTCFSILLLAGIVWASVATPFMILINPDNATIEYYFLVDTDSESNEKNSEEEKDDKIRAEYIFSKSQISFSINKIFNYSFIGSNFQPEIPTPPPELNIMNS